MLICTDIILSSSKSFIRINNRTFHPVVLGLRQLLICVGQGELVLVDNIPLTPTVVIMGTAIKQRQRARMLKISNAGLTRSGTAYFNGNSGRGVKSVLFSVHVHDF